MPCKACHKPKVQVFNVGEIYSLDRDGDQYIVANVDGTRYALICLNTGNRWRNAGELRDVAGNEKNFKFVKGGLNAHWKN